MIYMVEVYDLHFFGRLLSAERSLFLNITKIWWKFMIYLSQIIASGSTDLTCPLIRLQNFENFVGIYCINPTIQTPQDALWGLPTVRINDCTMNLPKRVVIQGVETWFSSSPHSPNILALR